MARQIISLTLVCLSALCTSQMPNAEAKDIDYNRDVRRILSDKCFTCHGPDGEQRQAGLRLDQQESAFAKLESGETAIVPANLTRVN